MGRTVNPIQAAMVFEQELRGKPEHTLATSWSMAEITADHSFWNFGGNRSTVSNDSSLANAS
jgi:hypothetical protein